MNKPRRAPWSVDRWGRFLSGLTVMLCISLALLHHPAWLIGTAATAASLLISSLSGFCLVHALLLKLGAREREDIFLPGGALRSEAPQAQTGKNECPQRADRALAAGQ